MFRALEITICSCLQSHQLVPGQHLEPQAQLGSGGKDPSGDPGVELETLWVSSAEGLAGSAGLRLRGSHAQSLLWLRVWPPGHFWDTMSSGEAPELVGAQLPAQHGQKEGAVPHISSASPPKAGYPPKHPTWNELGAHRALHGLVQIPDYAELCRIWCQTVVRTAAGSRGDEERRGRAIPL